MRRRKRAARTIDAASGADLGAIETPNDQTGFWAGFDLGNQGNQDNQGNEITWGPSIDPDVLKAIVSGGTPMPTNITGLSRVRNYPQAGLDTWYAPTTAAIARGKINAAIETAQATGEQLASIGIGLAENILPILLGLAALYVLFQMERR